MKMPSMQFYPADWRKDLAVQALGYFDRGVWFEMLCLMHESSERGVLLLNGAPMPDDAVARILGLDNQTFNQTLTTLLTYGVAKQRETDNAVYSKRMVADEKLCQVRREAGKLGGNPVLLNQNPTTGDKQKATPSSSSSSSSSKDLKTVRDGESQSPSGDAELELGTDTKGIVFSMGVPALTNLGVSEKSAKGLVGKCIKDAGEDGALKIVGRLSAFNTHPNPAALMMLLLGEEKDPVMKQLRELHGDQVRKLPEGYSAGGRTFDSNGRAEVSL